MKKIVCELCDSTEFVKEDGMFICQGCGTKYSLEEARNMMREVGTDEDLASTAPVSTSAMRNSNQAQIDNLLLLATNAYSASNNEEAEKYCNKVIEIDATCYKAWFLKAKAIGWSSTFKNPKITEAAHSFAQAVSFAPEEEKENLSNESVEQLKRLGLACMSIRQERFSKYPDDEELNGFISDMKKLIEGIVVILPKGAMIAHSRELNEMIEQLGELSVASKFEGLRLIADGVGIPKEYFAKIAVMMGNAAISGFETTTKELINMEDPDEEDFRETMNEVDNCFSLLEMANDASDDDDEDDIKRLEVKIRMQEFLINMKAGTWRLSDSAKNIRREKVRGYKKEIEEIKAKAEEEKQERIAAYWEAHPDEKAALDTEKKELEVKRDSICSEIKDIDAQIKAAQPVGFGPCEDEYIKLKNQIRALENEQFKLGLFAGKRKKQIGEEISSLSVRRDSLESKVEEEKKARQAEKNKKVASLTEKKDALQEKLNKITDKLAAVDAELEKDPEE